MKDDPIKDHPPIWGKDGSQVLFKERYPVVLKTYDKWKDLNPLLEKYIREQGVNRDNMRSVMTTVREIGQEYRSLEDKSGYKPSQEKLKTLSEAGLSDETISVVIEIIKALVVYDR